MEPIKIQVSVELNLSQDVKNFIATTVTNILTNAPQVSAPAPAAKPAPTPAPAAKPAPTPAPAAKPAPTPAPAATTSIEDVRKALASKVANHRAEIKSKLDELGAPSVTKLDPAKYDEMLDFLNALD